MGGRAVRIGVDCDGVMYDFVDTLREYLVSRGWSRDDLPDALEWDFYSSQWGLSDDAFKRYCARAVDEGWLWKYGQPIDGCLDALHALKSQDHTIHIVTNRSFGTKAEENTKFWLVDWMIPFDSLHFSADKTSVPVDVFIDDSPDNIRALCAARIPTIVFDQPWNQDIKPTECNRARGWDEVVRLVGEYPSRPPAVRQFDTGATRDQDDGKPDYEGFLSPLVIKRFGAYMHQHRVQSDGSLRASDNWAKGIPLDAYMKSAWRHFHDWWMLHRGYTAVDSEGNEVELEDALCALFFNTQGTLHEVLKRKEAS